MVISGGDDDVYRASVVTADQLPKRSQFRDRYALSPAEAAHALGVSRKHIYTLMNSDRLASRLIGSCRRIPVTEIERLAGITG
jgi:excisionase family DNA binding protein